MRLRAITLIVTVALATLVVPLAAAPPAGKVYRIGFLRAGQPPTAWVEAFQQDLRERGYVEGQNVVVEFRVTDRSLDPLPQLAAELVRSKSMSSWLRPHHPLWPPKTRPRPCLSSLSTCSTRSNSGSSRAWHSREATSQA